MKKLNVSLIIAVLFSFSAAAKTFSNTYISFEIPDDWNCVLEGPSWVCTPKLARDAKEVIIVVNAKVAGPEDNPENFKSYLAKPRNITSKSGTPITSKVYSVEERTIGGQTWIRAQHISSEVPDFYTLYMVTIRNQLAILATFSVDKNKALDYNKTFDAAVRSMKIVANRELLIPKTGNVPTNETIGIELGKTADDIHIPPPTPQKPKIPPIVWLLGLVAIIGGVMFYLRKSR
jgi:hypothetical protein